VVTNHNQIIGKLKAIVQTEISKIKANSTYDLSSEGSTITNMMGVKNSRNTKKIVNKSIGEGAESNNIKPINAVSVGASTGMGKSAGVSRKDIRGTSPNEVIGRNEYKKISLYKVDKKRSFEMNKQFDLKSELQNRESSSGKLSTNKIKLAFRNAFKSLKGNIIGQDKSIKKTFVKFKEDTTADGHKSKSLSKTKTNLEQYNQLKVKKNKTNLYGDGEGLANFSGCENNQDELFKRLQTNLGENFMNFFNFSYDRYHENIDSNNSRTIESVALGSARDVDKEFNKKLL
jgi:hypothetical protein